MGNLVLGLKLEDNLNDSSAYGNNGSLVSGNLLYTAGQVGRGFLFDDSTRFSIPNESLFDFNFDTPFSVALWIKPDGSAVSGFPTIIHKKSGGNTGWEVYWGKASQDMGFKPQSSTANFDVASIGDAFPSGVMKHFVATYSGNSNRNGIKMYVNGVLNNTGSVLASSGSMLNNNSVYIGAMDTGANDFKGIADEIKIYDYMLSAIEVKALYENRFLWLTKVNILRKIRNSRLLRVKTRTKT